MREGFLLPGVKKFLSRYSRPLTWSLWKLIKLPPSPPTEARELTLFFPLFPLRKPRQNSLPFFAGWLLRQQQAISRGQSHHFLDVDRKRTIAVEPESHLLVRPEFNFTLTIKGDHTL